MDSTISELKAAFIRSQVRVLSEGLELPEDWKSYAPETEEGELNEKVIEDVLRKVNAAAKRHHRVVYPSQAIYHVVEQIAKLYWNSVHPGTQNDSSYRSAMDKTLDMTRQEAIVKLPLDIKSHGATNKDNEEYQRLRRQLVESDQERQRQQQRLEQLRHLKRLLEPFKDPQKVIQPNLITRDGELVQELEKTRMLAARVGGRIAQQEGGSDTGKDQEYVLPGSKRKLDALLDGGGEE